MSPEKTIPFSSLQPGKRHVSIQSNTYKNGITSGIV
jgi:hypothetical protein